MRQVGGTAQQIRQGLRDGIDHLLRSLSRGDLRPLYAELLAKVRHRLGISAGQLLVERVMKRRPIVDAHSASMLDPGPARATAALANLAPMRNDLNGDFKGPMRPAKRFPGRGHFLGAERSAMNFLRTLSVRRAEPNHRAAGD